MLAKPGQWREEQRAGETSRGWTTLPSQPPLTPTYTPKPHVTYLLPSLLCYCNLCPLIYLPLVMLQVLLFSYSPILVSIVSFSQSRGD